MQNNIKYFMFSVSDMNRRKEIEANLGRVYKPGEVRVRGVYKQFTEIVSDPSESKYPDATVVASGDINTMKYKK